MGRQSKARERAQSVIGDKAVTGKGAEWDIVSEASWESSRPATLPPGSEPLGLTGRNQSR
jgi:hypothetical protein